MSAAVVSASGSNMARRGFSSILSVLVAFAVGGCAAPAPRAEGSADLVLRNGKIVTVNNEQPTAEALAIRGAWIVGVGTDEEMEAWIDAETEVVDLDGRTAIPGFIEGHGHFMDLGGAKTTLDLTGAGSWEEIVSMVAASVSQARPGDWILGRGWHQEKWTSEPQAAVDSMPTHTEMSAISPQNPVLLTHASGHAAIANAAAMKLAGVDRDTPDPAGGALLRDRSGAPTGVLLETAQEMVEAALTRSREQRSAVEVEREQRRWVELAGRETLSHGVTSFHDAGESFATIDLLRRLESEGALPVRLYVMVRFESNDSLAATLSSYKSLSEGDDYLVIRSIKRQIDGALGSHGAWLLEPYSDLPTSVGLVLESENEIRRTAEIAARTGFQLNTHAIGDRANRVVLDIYEEALGSDPGSSDRRWRIEHAQHLSGPDIQRFGELGVIASIQGIHCTSDAPWVLKRLGLRRAEEGAYVWRKLIDSGALLINGTDVPVESIDPIASFYASVSRRTRDGDRFFPDQAMTRDEALASYTLNAAYAAFEEDFKGSLEPGKLADIAVLSHDLMTIPQDKILDSRVEMTILGGQIRFRR